MDKLTALYRQFDPAKPLEADQTHLYVDWQHDLGPTNLKLVLARSIARSGPPLIRLFTGHRGVGKTTELNHLKSLLETGDKPFFVSMLEGERWLDLQDVAAPDIVYQIARQIVEDLRKAGFAFGVERFGQFFQEVWEQLNSPIDFRDLKVKPSPGFEIGIALKEVPVVRARIRDLLEKRLPSIYDLINDVILSPAREWLRRKGFEDIVVIVDELDRIPPKEARPGLTNHEDIFLNNAGTLQFLSCDLLLTVPMELAYSQCRERLKRAYAAEILALPVIPVVNRDGSDSDSGLGALRTIVDLRALYAGVEREELFAGDELLDQLCRACGGHLPNLFILIRSVMDRCDDLPLPADAVQLTIRQQAADLLLPLGAREKSMLREVHESKQPPDEPGEIWYGLLRDLFAFAYRDAEGEWYDWNPLLDEVLP